MKNIKLILVNISVITFMVIFIACKDETNIKTAPAINETRIEIESNEWQLIGDLLLPADKDSLSIVLMLNKANGNREVYKNLAHHLANNGIASLRLDLRGHGESTNLGKFIPGNIPKDPIIWDAELDVISAYEYLKTHPNIDANKIGILGSSYSGEEMAEAGRIHGFAQAYVAISPGSFSENSINGIDSSNVPWLFIASNNERFLKNITSNIQAQSKTVELIVIPGEKHASDILIDNENLSKRIAIWLSHKLN